MPQNRYPKIWQTEPHGEHTITLVDDQPNYQNRIYNISQKLPGRKGTRIITMLGSEIESMGMWLRDIESKRKAGMIPFKLETRQ